MASETKETKGRRKNIDAATFVKTAWKIKKEGGTITDLQKALDYPSTSSVHSRMNTLREAGVKLPKFADARKSRKLDPDYLNSLVEDIADDENGEEGEE